MPSPAVITSSGGLHRRRGARRQTVALGMALVLAIGGCAASQPTWTKPGVTRADLRRDLVDCEREATGPPPFHVWALNMDYEAARDRIARLKRQCMQDRGWRLAGAGPGQVESVHRLPREGGDPGQATCTYPLDPGFRRGGDGGWFDCP